MPDSDDHLDRAICEFLLATESGVTPDRQQYLIDYPEIASQLHEFFHTNAKLSEIGSQLQSLGCDELLFTNPDDVAEVDFQELDDQWTVEQFLSVLQELSLIQPSQRDSVISSVSPGDTEPSVSSIAEFLYKQDMLSRFQLLSIARGNHAALTVGDYTLVEPIGTGGMGHVYAAIHRTMNRQVALKLLPAEFTGNDEANRRFLREVQLAGQLVHPHIVTAFDAGNDPAGPYLVMQLVDGEDLRRLVKQLGPLSKHDALCCILQAAKGMAWAHEKGIIHRDIKPSNLLLQRDGVVMITDLGLAKYSAETSVVGASGDELTETRAIVGTADYMAPEQARSNESVDQRSDVYSMGCTLWYLLTGETLYTDANVVDKLFAHRHADIPLLTERGIPEDPSLQGLIERMVAKAPEARLQSMNEVMQGIHELMPCLADDAQRVPEITASIPLPGPKWLADETPHVYGRASHPTATEQTRSADPIMESTGHHAGPRLSKSLPKIASIIVLAALLFAVLASVIVKMNTPHGVLIVEVHEPNARILVDGQEKIVVSPADEENEYRISVDPGSHEVRVVTHESIELLSEKVTVKRGGRIVLTAQLEPAVRPIDEIKAGSVLTVAQDGTAQFQSINAALEVAVPHTTIRVLDDGVYPENLQLRNPAKFQGVTLEATRGATIQGNGMGVVMITVPDVTLRGFQLKAKGDRTILCLIGFHTPNVVIESNSFSSADGKPTFGVSLEMLGNENASAPVIIRDCDFRCYLGIQCQGLDSDYVTPTSCQNVLICNNRFEDCSKSISLKGNVQNVLVGGNVITNSGLYGIQMEQLLGEPHTIAITNNTIFQCRWAFRVWDSQVRGENVLIANNLSLDSGEMDWVFYDSQGSVERPAGAGDQDELVRRWNFANNWRETPGPDPDGHFAEAWLQPGDGNQVRESIDVTSRDHHNEQFLQPPSDGPLSEPSTDLQLKLPRYIGAIPPDGFPPWDWLATYRIFVNEGND